MEKIRIIDKRRKQFFMVDDEYLNGYAKLCGVSATVVYLSLCRHSNKSQSCFPSIRLIAEEHSITTRTVIRSIKKLIDWNIIKKTKRKRKNGKWLNNFYILIDKTEWKPKPSDIVSLGNQVTIKTEPGDNKDVNQVTLCHTKVYTYKGTHIREHILANQGLQVKKDLNFLIGLFKPINPTYDRIFKNKTQREALERMVKRFGFEKTKATIGALPEMVGKKYCPTITTPLMLESKLGQLLAFYKKEKENQIIEI